MTLICTLFLFHRILIPLSFTFLVRLPGDTATTEPIIGLPEIFLCSNALLHADDLLRHHQVLFLIEYLNVLPGLLLVYQFLLLQLVECPHDEELTLPGVHTLLEPVQLTTNVDKHAYLDHCVVDFVRPPSYAICG